MIGRNGKHAGHLAWRMSQKRRWIRIPVYHSGELAWEKFSFSPRYHLRVGLAIWNATIVGRGLAPTAKRRPSFNQSYPSRSPRRADGQDENGTPAGTSSRTDGTTGERSFATATGTGHVSNFLPAAAPSHADRHDLLARAMLELSAGFQGKGQSGAACSNAWEMVVSRRSRRCSMSGSPSRLTASASPPD